MNSTNCRLKTVINRTHILVTASIKHLNAILYVCQLKFQTIFNGYKIVCVCLMLKKLYQNCMSNYGQM